MELKFSRSAVSTSRDSGFRHRAGVLGVHGLLSLNPRRGLIQIITFDMVIMDIFTNIITSISIRGFSC